MKDSSTMKPHYSKENIHRIYQHLCLKKGTDS